MHTLAFTIHSRCPRAAVSQSLRHSSVLHIKSMPLPLVAFASFSCTVPSTSSRSHRRNQPLPNAPPPETSKHNRNFNSHPSRHHGARHERPVHGSAGQGDTPVRHGKRALWSLKRLERPQRQDRQRARLGRSYCGSSRSQWVSHQLIN